MRITGGHARGIPLDAPSGDKTRPATDRLREAVFSSMGSRVEGCEVADLFAGTGSYGLEALSRGARSATFFENDRSALACLKRNIEAVQRSFRPDTLHTRVVTRDVFTASGTTLAYNLIFLDPPYATIEKNLGRLFQSVIDQIAAPGGRVVVELPGNLTPDIAGWQIVRRIGKAGKDKPTALLLEQKHAPTNAHD